MAAVSWRLTAVLKCSLSSCRAIGPLFRQRAITRYCIPQATPTLYRQYSTKDIEPTEGIERILSPEEQKIYDRMDRGFIRRFFDWMNSEPEPTERVFSEEERLKREDLSRRLDEMHYSDPPIKPDLAFMKELIETMMTYNDRIAVENFWLVLPELKITPDKEFKEKVEAYLEKARRNSYFE